MRLAAWLVLLGATSARAVLPARDTFNRASLGANWSQTQLISGTPSPFVGCITSGSDVLAVNSEGAAAICYWNADTPSTASYACGQMVNGVGGPGGELDAGVCLGVDNLGGTPPNLGHAVCCTASPPGQGAEWNIEAFVDGMPTTSDFAPHVFAAGDYIGIQRTDATTFQCFASSDGHTWTALHAAYTIASIPVPGNLGAYAWSAVDNPFELTVWEGGNGTLPTATICGTSEPVTTTTTTTTSTTLGTTTSTSTTTSTTHTTTTTTTARTTTTTTTTLPHPCFPTAPCPCPPT